MRRIRVHYANPFKLHDLTQRTDQSCKCIDLTKVFAITGRVLSYKDDPVSIAFGQTISQPYMVALMAQCLELKGTEIVLDVGAGSGYGAALLGALAARVVSIELIEGLACLARLNLKRTA
jgi:protein-L-isoaspartate O-methyltransferase